MSKRFTTVVLILLIFTTLVLSYFCYAVYSEGKIREIKNQVVMAQRAWTNYFRTVNKINSNELNYIVNSSQLKQLLTNLNAGIQSNNNDEINQNLTLLEDYSFSKLSNDIDMIVVYTADGIIRSGFERDSDSIPFVNLPETISKVLDGNQLALNINLMGKLYYVNIYPVTSGGNRLGAVLLGKQINNGTAAYIQELSGANLVVFSKDSLLATSLPYITADNIFEQFRQIDPKIMNLINQTNPAQLDKIQYLELDSGDFWAAGKFIANKTAGYILLATNSRWVRPYLLTKSKLIYLIPALLLLSTLISMVLSAIIYNLTTSISEKATSTKEKIKDSSKKINQKLDKEIDLALNKILSFFNIDFFRSNKELNDVSSSIFSMIKEYKAKMIVENFSNNNALGNIVNPVTRNDCCVRSRKTTLYYSNIQEFSQLVEYITPSRAFTLLSIYLKIQQELILKNNGKIIKQVDDRIIASFETSTHAIDAIRAAFEIQNTILKLSKVNPESIELSIAISSGDVTTAYMLDQVSYVGPAAIVADTLCRETPPGWIYIDKLTYDFAGIENLKANQDMVVVKGRPNPVQYYKFDPDRIVTQNLTLQTKEKEEHLL